MGWNDEPRGERREARSEKRDLGMVALVQNDATNTKFASGNAVVDQRG